MYIKKINIKGFRNFSDADIEFHEGINVIIGHNNAGKSNLLKALQLVMEPHCKSRKLGVYDFVEQ
ncbi:ATP-dependent nuclease [Bacteroides fragilis]